LGTRYGAGFWTNRGTDPSALGRISGGMPCDTYFASGNLGQRVYIVPLSKLVIVRMGVTQERPDFDKLVQMGFSPSIPFATSF
jgi:hypothetical protein